MAVQETVDITINNSQAIASLRSIERNVDLLANGFRDFISGVAEGMTSALSNTNRLNTGVNNVRRSFDNLGTTVSKVDVGRKLDNQIRQATSGTSKLSSSLAQTGKQIIGLESIIGAFAISNLVRGAADYAKQTTYVSTASYSAVQAQDNLNKTIDNFYAALLEVSRPLTNLVSQINITQQAFRFFLETLITFGKYVLWIAAGILAGKLIVALRGMYLIITATGPAIAAAVNGFANLFKVLNNPLTRSNLITNLQMLSGGLLQKLGVLLTAMGINFQAIGQFVMANWKAMTLWGAATVTAITSAYDALLDYFGLSKKLEQSTGAVGRFAMSAEDAKKYGKTVEEWETKRANIIAGTNNIIKDDLDNFIRQNDAIRQQLALENKMFGMSQDSVDIAKLRLQFEQQRVQAISDLERKIRDLGPEETAAGAVALYRQQIETYKKLSFAAENAQIIEIKALQRKRAEQDAFNKQLEYATQQYEQQAQRAQALQSILQGVRGQTGDVLFERSQMGRGPIQQQIARAYEDTRKSALEAQRQFAESFGDGGDGLTPERMAELQRGLDQIGAAFRNLGYETENNILISQQWKTGWDEAFGSFVDNALNAADRAREVFTSLVSNMENALDNFVQTGKLNFRDLVGSIIKDLTSIALRQAFRNLFIQPTMGSGNWLTALGSFFAGFFAQGGFIPPGKAGIVGEAGPELVSGPAQVTPLTGSMAPVNNYYTYNINALDARSVAQLFSENRRTLLGVTEQARKEMPIRQRF